MVVDFKQKVANVLGKKYGNFNSCINGMNNTYKKVESTRDWYGTTITNTDYYKNDKLVATSFKKDFNDPEGTKEWQIIDYQGDALYNSKDCRAAKFNQITQGYLDGTSIEFNDINNNGFIDEADTARVHVDGKWSKQVNVSDLLSGAVNSNTLEF